MKTARSLAAATIAAVSPLCSGCSTILDLGVAGALEQPVITFLKGGGRRPTKVQLCSITIGEVTATRHWRSVWEAADADYQDCPTVAGITYPEVPGR